MGSKRNLIIAAVVILGVAIFLFIRNRERSPITDDILFVCVATGKTFTINRNDVNDIPMKNPSTGQMTLVPCSKNEDGTLMVGSRNRDLVKSLGEVNRYVDPNTLAVRKP